MTDLKGDSKKGLDENTSTSTKEEKQKDEGGLGEKLEDTLDEVVGGAQDFLYGEENTGRDKIISTIEKPNGIRKINKIQTKRNIMNKIGYGRYFKILAIILGLGLLMLLFYTIAGAILGS